MIAYEEVEVTPCFLGGVVHRHAAGAALRAIEARARLEVEMDIEAALIIVEVGRRYEPGRCDPESKLKEVIVTHRAPSVEEGGWVGLILAPIVTPWRASLKDKPSLEER